NEVQINTVLLIYIGIGYIFKRTIPQRSECFVNGFISQIELPVRLRNDQIHFSQTDHNGVCMTFLLLTHLHTGTVIKLLNTIVAATVFKRSAVVFRCGIRKVEYLIQSVEIVSPGIFGSYPVIVFFVLFRRNNPKRHITYGIA